MSDFLTDDDRLVNEADISGSALELAAGLVREFEQGPNGGYAKELYECPGGEMTIGYGHAMRNDIERQFFEAGCDEETANRLLFQDLTKALLTIKNNVETPLTVMQTAALASFVFNVGPTHFKESTLLRKLNDGAPEAVPDELRRWIFADGVELPGLVRRREAEVMLGSPWG